ncbi:type II 3-dehydroquinate dehydratase [Amycolatopsis palatopharyngis]|uniref:type II 3-dehydroquinate dehydratase n=1 Tax=Amycolatopsis palatopharyngis TaxID=187982 RepID=UPI000E26E44E|nr:type II 3-dehydroquinate dehydratase [Amycolatopsis palatopharyngis]
MGRGGTAAHRGRERPKPGRREPGKYGTTTYDQLAESCRTVGEELGLTVRVRQTNAEHEMLGWVHEAADEGAAVVLNPAAWTHTSVALRDACAMLTGPLVEVHITNVHAREPFRAHSYISPVATASIVGCGPEGYELALRWLARRETP